ncbi:hypothetical protein [Nocardioides baekrokdamisoli]|nr:hypothetical protein [Nocardioides baekrokdamisoli]
MSTSPPKRRHLASSPFRPDPEPFIETFVFDELVNHDSYGMGRIIAVEAHAVTVDFRPEVVRIVSPYKKLSRL